MVYTSLFLSNSSSSVLLGRRSKRLERQTKAQASVSRQILLISSTMVFVPTLTEGQTSASDLILRLMPSRMELRVILRVRVTATCTSEQVIPLFTTHTR